MHDCIPSTATLPTTHLDPPDVLDHIAVIHAQTKKLGAPFLSYLLAMAEEEARRITAAWERARRGQ
jgi:hypothetical protein